MVRQRASARTSYMAAPPEPVDPDDPLLGFAPVPHVAARHNSITAERQRAFIAHLAATGIVKQAARQIGASLEALYKLRHRPGAEAFSAAWDMAVDRGVQRLEDCALARAIEGEERLVVSGGKVLGTERRHNDALVMFLLRNRRAARYGTELLPGHPAYERLRERVRAEIAAEDTRTEAEVLEEIDALIFSMRKRHNKTPLIEGEYDELGDEEDLDDEEDDDRDEDEDGEYGGAGAA